MAGFKLSIAIKGYSQATKRLEKLFAVAKRPSVPAMQSAVWLVGQTIKAFEEGGHPEKWVPISMMTSFIRAHRAKAPTDSKLPLNDSGRLKGSFFPVIESDGNSFGASTAVEYAPMMQAGGKSDAGDVDIAGYVRRIPGRAVGLVRGKTVGTGRVRPYTMHLKGGSDVPPRPFFPDGVSELQGWGYHETIKQIFADYFNDTWNSVGGTA